LRAHVELALARGRADDAARLLFAMPEAARDVDDWTNISSLLADQGKGHDALMAAKRGMELSPRSARAAFAFGRALDLLGASFVLVRTAYEHAVALGDDEGRAGTRLGYLLLTRDDVDPNVAVTILDGAVKKTDAPGAKLNLALASWKSGDTTRAQTLAGDVLRSTKAAPSERSQAQKILQKLAA
jgi:Flp pilus assembly protein TadD